MVGVPCYDKMSKKESVVNNDWNKMSVNCKYSDIKPIQSQSNLNEKVCDIERCNNNNVNPKITTQCLAAFIGKLP